MNYINIQNLNAVVEQFNNLTVNEISKYLLTENALEFLNTVPPVQLVQQLLSFKEQTKHNKILSIISSILMSNYLLPSYKAVQTMDEKLKATVAEIENLKLIIQQKSQLYEEKMKEVNAAEDLIKKRSDALNTHIESMAHQMSAFEVAKAQYNDLCANKLKLEAQYNEIKHKVEKIGMNKFESVKNMYDRLKTCLHDLTKEITKYVHTADYVKGTCTKEILEIIHMLHMNKHARATKNKNFVHIPEQLKGEFDEAESKVLQIRPAPTGDYELDSFILHTYSKFTLLTNFRVASWFRAELSQKYSRCYPKTFAQGNKAKLLWCTYIDPFRIKGEDKLREYLELNETDRRKRYFDFYKAFDRETGNCISMFSC